MVDAEELLGKYGLATAGDRADVVERLGALRDWLGAQLNERRGHRDWWVWFDDRLAAGRLLRGKA